MADTFSNITNVSFGVQDTSNSVLESAASNLSQNPFSNSFSSGIDASPKSSNIALRYPLRRIDSKSDYLEIRIVDYVPPGFTAAEISTVDANPNDTTTPAGEREQVIQGVNSLAKLPQGSNQYNTKTKTLYYIKLPIPQNISDTNQVTWGDDSINPLEAFGISAGAKFVRDPGKTTQAFVQSITSGSLGNQALSAIQGNKDLIAAAVGGALYSSLGGNVSASGILARASGQILNPNMELLFQGMNIRSFPFTFDFAPRDQREAIEIKNIIRAFKQSIAPTTTVTNDFTSGIFIKSPKIFLLSYMSGNRKHPFLNQFKPCALTDMQLNYTGSGTYATYQDGTPVHIQMSLTFKELNPIYSEDYNSSQGQTGVGY